MSGEDRRRAPRILSEYPLVIEDDRGTVLDDRALAHEVSEKGFKLETQAELDKEQRIRFKLVFDRGEELTGVARIAWTEKNEFARWAGAEFSALSWADVRRLRRLVDPSHVDWDALADKAVTALGTIVGVALIYKVLYSPTLREVLYTIFPKALATFALGWSLRELFRSSKR